jgi:hypothetical protein
MSGRGMLEHFLLDRVLAEPGDGAQPPGDRGAGTPAVFQVAGGRFDVSAADREQGRDRAPHQVVNCRRSRVYASRVWPRYPARNPASARRSASVNRGWTGTRTADRVVAVMETSRVMAETRRTGLVPRSQHQS